jgi:two-component system response regulator HydG
MGTLETKGRVLIVDDDQALVETLSDGLTDLKFEVTGVSSSKRALSLLGDDYDVVVTDLRMPMVDGIGLLAASRKSAPERPVIVMTAYSAVDSAVAAMKEGAHHYMTKPFRVDELALFLERAIQEYRLRREARALRRAVRDSSALENVVGDAPSMQDLRDLVRRLADADASVLVLGETGTGKGLLARALHAEGSRSAAPFVTVNCAALPDNLLESELFGHTKGAFTGATHDRRGLLTEAAGGTIFLDEIGELTAAMQAKLLDVLERRVVRPVGSDTERPIDVRIVTATHRDLPERVAAGTFRGDLLFRLDVVRLEIPALRHRKGDIPLLAAHFLARARAKHPRARAEGFSQEAMDVMVAHAWPGNVRELEHVIERAVILGASAQIAPGDLPRSLGGDSKRAFEFSGNVLSLEAVQRHYAAWALEQLGGRRMATAEALDIDPKTLARLVASTKPEK